MDKRDQLAKEILTLSRNTLLVHLRFLDLALSQFVWEPISESTMLTGPQPTTQITRCFL